MKRPGFFLSFSIGLLIFFVSAPCYAAKVTLEKEEVFSDDEVFLGFRDFPAPVLATLGVALIADFPSYVAGEVADSRLAVFEQAASDPVEVIRVPAGVLTGTFSLRVNAAALAGKGVPGLDGGAPNQDFALYVHNATQ